MFVLKKGTKEDVVLTVDDWPETEVPLVLESETLGIKLVADVSRIPTSESPAAK